MTAYNALVMPMDLKKLKARLRGVLAGRPEVRLAYLFGSTAQGESKRHRASDVDIAVLLDERLYRELDEEAPFGYRAALTAALMEALGTERVDLVVLNEAPPLLAHEVVRRGVAVFCRDERERVAFEVRTKQRYLDTKPLREIKRRYLYARIDQERLSEVRGPSSTGT